MFKPRETRHSVLIRAQMRGDGPVSEVCVRNVSSRGLLLQAASAPPPGSYIEVLMPGVSLVGRVVWASERRFGVQSRDRIPLARIIGTAAVPAETVRQIARPTHAAPARSGEWASAMGHSMQSAFLIACGVAAAAGIGWAVFDSLFGLASKVSGHLAQ